MKSVTTEDFRNRLNALPATIRRRAHRAFKLWVSNPSHPSLNFRRVHQAEQIFSARIGLHYRAVALVGDEVTIWYWIGSHSDYDKLIDSS